MYVFNSVDEIVIPAHEETIYSAKYVRETQGVYKVVKSNGEWQGVYVITLSSGDPEGNIVLWYSPDTKKLEPCNFVYKGSTSKFVKSDKNVIFDIV